MKFRYLILALATLSMAPVLPSCTYSQILHRQEDGMAQLNRVLSGVQDKASADAAAPVVRQYGSQLRQDISKIISNGKPNLVQLAMLKQSYQNSNINEESKGALTQLFRVYGQGFYGSTELKQAFLDVMLNSGTTTTTTESATPTQTVPQLQNLQNLKNNLQKLQQLKNLKTLSSQS